MRRAIRLFVAAALALTVAGVAPVSAGSLGRFEVHGVGEDDMLKMRGGPGIGYDVLLGLPDGTVLHVYECTQTGGTRWCRAALDHARRAKGWVSWAYLRKL